MTTAIKQNGVNEFVALIEKGIECWMKAGEMYVRMLSEDPEMPDKIVQEYPSITKSILRRFEQLGNGTLHPKLLMSNCIGARCLRAMPYSEQEEYFQEPLKYLVSTNDGTESLMIGYASVDAEQAKQLFARDHVRSLGEQRAYIEAKKTQQKIDQAILNLEQQEKSPWVVKRKKLFINYACVLSKDELVAALAKMV